MEHTHVPPILVGGCTEVTSTVLQ